MAGMKIVNITFSIAEFVTYNGILARMKYLVANNMVIFKDSWQRVRFFPTQKIPDKQARVFFRMQFGSAQDNCSARMQFDLM